MCGTSSPIKPGAKNPHDYYPFSTGKIFEGVISGDGQWKLHLPHNNSRWTPGKDGVPGKYDTKKIELSLFDMENDPYETTNVLDSYPEVAKRLRAFAEEHRREFYPDQPL